jgi:hypothetical protein
MRYYFDMREGESLALDDEGLELPSLAAAEQEAALSLADMAKDTVRGERCNVGQRLAIEVRNDAGPVLELKFTFGVKRMRR